MVTATVLEERGELLGTFALYVSKLYSAEVAEWVTKNWKVVEDEHLCLIKHLKSTQLKEVRSILDLSLGVALVEIPRFVMVAEAFITYPAAKLVFECLHKNPKQQRISFESLLVLIDCIRSHNNQPAITTYRGQFINTPLAKWIELIDFKRAEIKVANVDSIQFFIDKLTEAYGEVIVPKLGTDLTKSDD
jgi:hypothetical protein